VGGVGGRATLGVLNCDGPERRAGSERRGCVRVLERRVVAVGVDACERMAASSDQSHPISDVNVIVRTRNSSANACSRQQHNALPQGDVRNSRTIG
jgi:hypothetical protein